MARSKKQKRAIAQRISQKRAKKENERAKSLRPNDKNHHVVHGIFVSEGLCYRPCWQFMFQQHKLSNNQRPSNDESSTDGLSFILSSSQNHLAPITQNSLENCAESYDSSPASTVSTILNSAESSLKEQNPDTGHGLDSSRDSYLQHGSCYEEQEVIALESRSVGFVYCTESLPSNINNDLVELVESDAQDEFAEIDKKLLGKFICHSTTKTMRDAGRYDDQGAGISLILPAQSYKLPYDQAQDASASIQAQDSIVGIMKKAESGPYAVELILSNKPVSDADLMQAISEHLSFDKELQALKALKEKEEQKKKLQKQQKKQKKLQQKEEAEEEAKEKVEEEAEDPVPLNCFDLKSLFNSKILSPYELTLALSCQKQLTKEFEENKVELQVARNALEQAQQQQTVTAAQLQKLEEQVKQKEQDKQLLLALLQSYEPLEVLKSLFELIPANAIPRNYIEYFARYDADKFSHLRFVVSRTFKVSAAVAKILRELKNKNDTIYNSALQTLEKWYAEAIRDISFFYLRCAEDDNGLIISLHDTLFKLHKELSIFSGIRRLNTAAKAI